MEFSESGDWKQRVKEEKGRGRMFFVDDEKKLERIFALAGSGRKREGKGTK